MKSCLIIIVLYLSSSSGYAFLGEVIVVGDVGHAARIEHMVQQINEAQKIVNESRTMVNHANRLVQIAGDPKSVIHSMKDLNSAARQMDQIFKSPTTREMRKLVNGSDSLTRSGYQFKGELGNSFISGKKQHPRQANLYQTYALMESNYDHFETLIESDRFIQQAEAKRQEELINDLVNATTQSEVDKVHAAISCSRAAQEASSHQVMKQKMEMEMQQMAMDTEFKKIETARLEERAQELKEAKERLTERNQCYQNQLHSRINTRTGMLDEYQFFELQ